MKKFNILKDEFKKAIKNHLNYTATDGFTLSSIHFETIDDELIIASTDGNKLLETKLKIYLTDGNDIKVNYKSNFLRVAKIQKCALQIKDFVDELEITMDEKELIINDFNNKFIYKIPALENSTFPDYKQLFPNLDKNYQTIAIGKHNIQQLKDMITNKKTGEILLHINKNDSNKAIIAEAQNENIENRALIMPMQIRNY